MSKAPCPTCQGAKVVPVTRIVAVAGCCGNPTRTGECCGNAVPVPEEVIDYEPCPDCGGRDDG